MSVGPCTSDSVQASCFTKPADQVMCPLNLSVLLSQTPVILFFVLFFQSTEAQRKNFCPRYWRGFLQAVQNICCLSPKQSRLLNSLISVDYWMIACLLLHIYLHPRLVGLCIFCFRRVWDPCESPAAPIAQVSVILAYQEVGKNCSRYARRDQSGLLP